MSNRSVYSIRCADGVVRSINEDDMAACLKHWGWLTPEDARRLRGVMRSALAACFDAGSSDPAMDALQAEVNSWPPSDEVTVNVIDLESIKARLAGATPGPWTSKEVWEGEQRSPIEGSVHILKGGDGEEFGNVWDPGEAALIAHAPEDLAALVAEVERLRALLARVTHRTIIEEPATAHPARDPEALLIPKGGTLVSGFTCGRCGKQTAVRVVIDAGQMADLPLVCDCTAVR